MVIQIVHIVDSLIFSGGVNNFVYDLCKALHDFNVDVMIIGLMNRNKNKAMIKELEDYGIQVYCLNMKNKKEAVARGPRELRNILKRIISNKFIILNLHLKLSVLVGTTVAMGAKNIKCVETYHSQYRNYFLEYKLVSKRIQKYICCSESAKEEFVVRFNPPTSKICAIPNGINRYELVRSVCLKSLEVHNKVRFLSVGRFTNQKNFIVTAKAFSNLASDQYEYKIIGEGPQESEIIDIVVHCANEILVNTIPRQQIFAELNKSDMVVIPSLWEGLSIFMLEAMAMECPLMISDTQSLRNVMGVKELDEEEHWRVCDWGYLVSANNVDAYREAAQHYISHQELKKDMKNTIRKISNKYDIETTAKGYIGVYKEISNSFFL